MSAGSSQQARSAPPESALIVRVAAAEPYVAGLRERFDPVAPLGVPAHVTILVPFVPPERIDDGVVRRLRDALDGTRPFPFRLAEVRCFPDVVYLAPEPAEPFLVLTSAVHRAFPECPPYGGAHASVVPHLTVAHVFGDAQRTVADELRRALPRPHGIEARCDELVLIENTTGRWRPIHVLALA
jgi:2'-5' RNA ligase